MFSDIQCLRSFKSQRSDFDVPFLCLPLDTNDNIEFRGNKKHPNGIISQRIEAKVESDI